MIYILYFEPAGYVRVRRGYTKNIIFAVTISTILSQILLWSKVSTIKIADFLSYLIFVMGLFRELIPYNAEN